MLSGATEAVFRRVDRRYRQDTRFARFYIASKLRRDPVHADILALAARERFGDVVDVGCGRGQLGVALLEAGLASSVLGLDRDGTALEAARRAGEALGLCVRIQDLALDQTIPPAESVLLIDVLYQLRTEVQDALINQAVRVARTRVLIRTLDPGRGARSAFSLVLERLGRRIWPNAGALVSARPVASIVDQLADGGFSVDTMPCWRGTPFANVLLIARRTEHPG